MKSGKNMAIPFRRLVNGDMVPEFTNTTAMTIESRCPGKWLFVDMETNDVWRYDEGRFVAVALPDAQALKLVAENMVAAILRRRMELKNDEEYQDLD